MANYSFLVGKTIVAVFLAADKKALKFEFSDGATQEAWCDGDCCSDTWIESLSLPAGGLPAKIMAVNDLPLREKEAEHGDLTQIYGLKITTPAGYLDLDFRNTSNGYYGGNLYWKGHGEYFYGGVYGQNRSEWNWQPVGEGVD